MNESEASQNMEKRCPQCGTPLPTGALEGLCPACLLKQGQTETATQPEVTPFEPPSVEAVAKLFPQLEILAFIGKGGMGAVYKARQRTLDRLVALKILPPQVASGAGFAERFSREARALARLSHPNIVAIYEFGQVEGMPFFVMEFVDGLNLRQLEREGKLTPREALQIVPQICEALQFAHDEGIVHRDIKPENILLDKKGRVKIADFGIAKIMGRAAEVALTETQGTLGTPQYMAPEQIEKPQAVDHRADIFSLGVVFYEMLTGELPLGKFSPPSRKVQVDVRLDDVVLRTLEKEPERRYQKASQVKSAVETISSTAPPPAQTDAETMAREVLNRDYVLDIRSCLRRGWTLVKSDFWPTVGVTALILVLFGAASAVGAQTTSGTIWTGTSVIGILLAGPLFGGLNLYYLKKIRGETVNIETAFSGFSNRFMHLFLGSFVVDTLTWLGFLCLIVPGVYLMVAWMWTLPLIIDKRLDFWPAMQTSMKVVNKNWWKFLLAFVVFGLVAFSGVVACGFGVFITIPIGMAALMYAFEDVFGAVRTVPSPAPAGVGPSGTVLMPANPGEPSRPWGAVRKPAVAVLLVAVAVVLVASLVHRSHKARVLRMSHAQIVPHPEMPEPPQPPEPPAPADGFGSVEELVVTQAINFSAGKLISVPDFASASGDSSEKLAQNLRQLELLGADVYLEGDPPKLYALGTALAPFAPGDWDTATSEQVQSALSAAATNAMPLVKIDPQDDTGGAYAFKTREAASGLLQVLGLADEPRGVKLRYKLLKEAAAGKSSEDLALRLEAAATISNSTARDSALAVLAKDAAKVGNVDLVQSSLGHMINGSARDQAAREAARLLAKRGLRREAIGVAQTISNMPLHDQAMAELAK
jgi:predicted Ser/Thr protein kinase